MTQVLSELEFNVESCIEPFAAVKKLMGQHFDAVVVDCDNEQNATLLFKSARNSTSNQTSLAVAVVEGQAGVAKAFRIGANLVLTKPINIEQAKGTLRVARGLLRKSEPAKPAAAARIACADRTSQTCSARKTSSTGGSRDSASGCAGSGQTRRKPSMARDCSSRGYHLRCPGRRSARNRWERFRSRACGGRAAEAKASAAPGLPAAFGSGAASAPAPAREAPSSQVAEISPARTASKADALFEKPAEAAQSKSSSLVGSAPSFSFGGANAPEESSGGSKKMLLGLAAAVIVAAGLYAGFAHFQGRTSQPATTQTSAARLTAPAPVASPQIAKPSGAQPATASVTPATSFPSSQPTTAPAKKATNEAVPDSADADPSSEPPSASPAAGKTGAEAKPAESPLMVKGGTAPVHATPAAPDAPAPSMIGIATPGAGAPPPNLVGGAGSAPTPVLQTLNISQGVSQGLLLKKVQPIYPKNALFMRVEGSVELMATISKTGDISQVKVVSGDSQLTRAATDAVKQWKYKPYLLNGEPVEIQTQITINFKLPK